MSDSMVLQAQAPASVTTHTRAIGIIEPPSDIRTIVEKMAKYVSRNGLEFERKVIENYARNDKFNFLKSSDPYHAYYQQKLSEYRALYEIDSDAEFVDDSECDVQAQFRLPTKPLEAPESEKYTVRFPEWITAEELDVIRLTAQFVARNGNSFLRGLQSREDKNPQFCFMKPTHSKYAFFTAMVDAYSAVLMPPKDSEGKDIKEKLRKSVACMMRVLERCLHRLEWDRFQEKQRQKEEEAKEMERVQMAMIDWLDFVEVETIDFVDEEDEELNLPMTLEEVIRSSKNSATEEDEIVESGKEVEMEMDEEEVKLVAEGVRIANVEENGGCVQIENVNDGEAPMRIVENWRRPEDRFPTERNLTEVVVSPITSELIPINEMSEHIRISLIDPRLKEQKERMFAKIRGTTLAPDDEIAKNIVGLASLRPDIFGTTEEEVSNAVKAQIEKKKDEQSKQCYGVYADPNSFPGLAALPPNLSSNLLRPPPSAQYPGVPRPSGVPMMQPMHQQHQPSMPRLPGHPSMMVNRPPQMHPGLPVLTPPGSQFSYLQVPKPYNWFPAPSMGIMQPPTMPGMHLPTPLEEAPLPLSEEPEQKRRKINESVLVPEEQFLAQHPGSATIRVSVPNVDDGQIIEITVLSLSENVGSVKERIAGETEIPANKQKLSGKAGFLKDNMSLAHYNVGSGEILTLSLRERGGRKR